MLENEAEMYDTYDTNNRIHVNATDSCIHVKLLPKA